MAMQDMVKCFGTEDVFFDSVDHLSAEDSTVDGVLGCEFWGDELKSVEERRDSFLHKMGFVDPGPQIEFETAGSLQKGLERMMDRSEAVSNSSFSSSMVCEEDNVVGSGRECTGSANVVVDEPEHDQPLRESVSISEDDAEPSSSSNVCRSGECDKKFGHWWSKLMNKRRGLIGRCKCKGEIRETKKFEMSRVKVQLNKKKIKELSALFEAQEIQAHKGAIWTMKFSPDGQYLASGGQDGVVRVWRVKSVDSWLERFTNEASHCRDEKMLYGGEKKVKVPIVVPDKMFRIEEQPVQEFHGHAGDVLDLAWSQSNFLLSSSTDGTVRMWQLGSSRCVSTFLHSDYVTCVQFNPVDDRYFISGSLDGKVRIWGVSKRRVLDWADVRDAVTAVCYQPDGQGFVVGSLAGTCRFYQAEGDLMELSEQILIRSSKRSSTNRITAIQFLPEDSQRVMVMSEDSKLQILDKMDVVCRYRGLPKSGCQMSASLTSNGRHIISVGEDSRVYMWNHEDQFLSTSSHKKSIRSCEHFRSEGVSVAVPVPGTETSTNVFSTWSTEHEAAPSFSLRNMVSSKNSAIWPEDVLPVFSSPQVDGQELNKTAPSPAWGLVLVTANCDGVIRTFHNYGLITKV